MEIPGNQGAGKQQESPVQWNCASLECRVEPCVQFSKISEPWTELWSGSQKFRFKLKFWTEL